MFWLMRVCYFVAGFHRARVIDENVERNNTIEASIIVIAPHSSLFDSLMIPILGAPSIVARKENANTWFIGSKYSFIAADILYNFYISWI